MFPIKLEGSGVVIEIWDIPVLKCMAFYATSQTVDFKLFKMSVRVTIRAGLRHMGKLLNGPPGAVGFIMAGTACNSCMFTGKGKACW
jgi:hypothetical protein